MYDDVSMVPYALLTFTDECQSSLRWCPDCNVRQVWREKPYSVTYHAEVEAGSVDTSQAGGELSERMLGGAEHREQAEENVRGPHLDG